MARVHKSKKIRSGKDVFCGRIGCGLKIEVGENYFYWEPRYGPKSVRCYRHYPKQSETTTSKMADVYAATEDAQEWAQQNDGIEAVEYDAQIDAVRDVAEQVKGEYEEAAEQFGGAGENADRAEELDQFISELDNVDFEDFKEWKESHEDDADAWREEQASAMNEALDQVP
jgi:hypothetical protein